MSSERHASPVQEHSQPIQSPPPEVVAQLIENQTKELEIRQKEIAIAEHNNEMQFSFANNQLEAQERDRKDERTHREKRFSHALCAAVAIVIVIFLFFGYCINKGKSEMVVELFKAFCYGGSFGAGGFAWGRYRAKADSDGK